MTVMVVDDSILFRKVLVEIISGFPDVTVVGQAPNGKLAIQKARALQPDVMTLDLEMPEIDGLAVLDALRSDTHVPRVLVVSALSRRGGDLALKALAKGAFDFITKPEASELNESRAQLKEDLYPRLRALSLQLSVRSLLKSGTQKEGVLSGGAAVSMAAVSPEAVTVNPVSSDTVAARMNRLGDKLQIRFILIGVSTGGPNALALLFSALQPVGVPVFVVQHMPALFTQALAENLSRQSALKIREAVDGETACADTVYIAPGGRHMKLASGPECQIMVRVTDDPPEKNCRPSVDYLFRSAAYQFPGQSLAVILTGMGDDGALGLRLLKRHPCLAIAQNESSSVVFGMPKAAIDTGLVDEVLPLAEIAAKVNIIMRGSA